MSSRALLTALRRKREKTVDLGDGKKVTFLRPAEAEMGQLLSGEGEGRTWSVGVEHVKKFVSGWSGFTEEDFLGKAVGSTDEVPFDPDLWAEVCVDQIAWVTKVADAILSSVVAHINDRDTTAKNSEPA